MKKLLAAIFSSLLCAAFAQNVSSLRQASTDLPQTDADRTVVNLFFGSISAVQTPCDESLKASLEAEKALAACASFDNSMYMGMGETLTRQTVDMSFYDMTEPFMGGKGEWLSPWQNNEEFGTARQLGYEGSTYYLTLDAEQGLARVIKFAK